MAKRRHRGTPYKSFRKTETCITVLKTEWINFIQWPISLHNKLREQHTMPVFAKIKIPKFRVHKYSNTPRYLTCGQKGDEDGQDCFHGDWSDGGNSVHHLVSVVLYLVSVQALPQPHQLLTFDWTPSFKLETLKSGALSSFSWKIETIQRVSRTPCPSHGRKTSVVKYSSTVLSIRED